MKDKALAYGKAACDTMMAKFQAADLPPKGGFHYHQGVFLSGMMNLYSVCGDEKYYEYMKAWVDSIIPAPGIIDRFFKGALDDYMSGILLFPLYERTKDEKYFAALKLLMPNLRNWLRNEKGGFWHKEWRYHQMWLDGLYMAGPLQAIYARKFNEPEFAVEAVKQALIMYENMQDEETKLLYHAWDCSRQEAWADRETGLSEEFWGRALGWYVVAVLDIMEQLNRDSEEYHMLDRIEREVLEAVCGCQSRENGLWYQVLNKAEVAGNWPESSCSCLFTYALAKAVRMGVIGEEYLENALSGFEGVLSTFITMEEGMLSMSGVCVGTGVNNYEGYIKRPTSINDLHGMGAFLLMCAEIARMK